MAVALKPIPSENDWEVDGAWLMNQNEPLGATRKRVRWSIPKETLVQIGFPERVPGVGPSYTQPFKVGDVFQANPIAENSEPQLVILTSQRQLERTPASPRRPSLAIVTR